MLRGRHPGQQREGSRASWVVRGAPRRQSLLSTAVPWVSGQYFGVTAGVKGRASLLHTKDTKLQSYGFGFCKLEPDPDLNGTVATDSGSLIRSLETMPSKHVGLQKTTVDMSVSVTIVALDLDPE